MGKPRQGSTGPIFHQKTLQAWRTPGTYCDQKRGGLYLRVRHISVKGALQWEQDRKGNLVPKVTKYWSYRYWQTDQNGKRKLREFGIGSFNDFTLEEAREVAREQRKARHNSKDPLLERKAQKHAAQEILRQTKTFQEATQACWEAHRAKWKPRHADDWLHSIQIHAFPTLGQMDIRTIQKTHIEEFLRPIWNEKAETASRVRGRVEMIFNFAKGKGWYGSDNPAAWKGNLDALLIESPRLKQLENQPSLPHQQIRAFVAALRKEQGVAARALEFTILTATRSGEVRAATGEEFDLKRALWTIPKEHAKTKVAHVIPLCSRAIEILKGLGELKKGVHVFPGGKPEEGMSDAAMLALLKRMHAKRMEQEKTGWCDEKGVRIVTHGFRATFKTWGTDCTEYAREIIEFALAHKVQNKVEAAYTRGSMIEKRRPLMHSWADYCDPNGSHANDGRQFRRVRDYSDPDQRIKLVEIPSE